MTRHPPPSDHFDGRRFFNPGVSTDKSIADLIRWQRMRTRAAWPAHVPNPPRQPLPTDLAADDAAFTFIGHASYLIQFGGTVMLTDPVFSERASPFTFAGPKRVRAPGLTIAQLPPVDLVLLSHNHYDHLDLASLKALATRFRPTIVTGLGNAALLERHGIRPVVELDWWDRVEPKPGCAITFTPAQHWSSRTMFDRRRTLWGGHWVETQAGRFYVAGDSGYFGGFREIRARLGTPDVAVLPIGAYEPRWFMQSQHMDPAEAVQAHLDLGARRSLAGHWGTFQLTDEGIEAPVRALETALQARGIAGDDFRAPLPGETLRIQRAAAG
jgi:L-ascorbate metabolism protein UlaG (beta-lactamase superfamily)